MHSFIKCHDGEKRTRYRRSVFQRIAARQLRADPGGSGPAAASLAELEVLLENVIAKEDYESASRIRDYIDKRKGSSP